MRFVFVFIFISGATFTVDNAEGDEYWFYCFAQNIMTPTQGKTVISPPSGVKYHIIVLGKQTSDTGSK